MKLDVKSFGQVAKLRCFVASLSLAWLAGAQATVVGAAESEPAAKQQQNPVTLYSARKAHLIQPLLTAYTKATGVQVKLLTDKAPALLERLKAEGKRTQADLFMTVDVGNLWAAEQAGVLQTVDSEILESNIAPKYRSPAQAWFGLTIRARAIAYHPGRVDQKELSTYADLASPNWKGRLCLRTSQKVYNRSLVGMMLVDHGEQATVEALKGWVKNLAAPVFKSDTQVLKAVAAGQCDLGVVNTYYFGRLQRDQKDWPLKLYWPGQSKGESGLHVNLSGAGVTRYAKNPKGAIKLLEWLSSLEAQQKLADLNLEYPIHAKAEPAELVRSWGPFRPHSMPLWQLGEKQPQAVRIIDRAGYL